MTAIYWRFTAYELSVIYMNLTDCGLVTPYGHIELDRHWLRLWLIAWQHQVIISTNVDLSSNLFCGIHLRTISQEMLMKSANVLTTITDWHSDNSKWLTRWYNASLQLECYSDHFGILGAWGLPYFPLDTNYMKRQLLVTNCSVLMHSCCEERFWNLGCLALVHFNDWLNFWQRCHELLNMRHFTLWNSIKLSC